MEVKFEVERIDHVEVLVRDLAKSAQWYGKVLGLRTIGNGEGEPLMIEAGGTKLALFRAAGDNKGKPDGSVPRWHRVAWRTDEAGFLLAQQHLRELGIAYRGPVDHQVAFSLYFDDPDGNPLEVVYYP